jgi:hypothetical protein
MEDHKYFSLDYRSACPNISGMKKLISRLSSRQTAHEVHFHQGPQGQAAPCFDERCPLPRLSA